MKISKYFAALFAALAAAVLASACGAPVQPDDEPKPWLDYAAEPVDSVRYANLVDWQPLGRNSVMIRFEGRRFFLVEIRQPCIGHVREANRLGLDTAFARTLRVNDTVRLDSYACMVGEIRPLDWRAFTQAKAES
jgi:hypothetical protein